MLLVLALTLIPVVQSLNNGLAVTPPLGWLTWERFRCNIDCTNDPKNCISENLIMEMADKMVSDGYKDAGYEYIIIDDCWPAKNRTPDGKLQGDPIRFPHGMKALADYVHSKGLKFELYEDFGQKTCAGYPGSEFYLEMDAQTFAEWGVDFVKFDQCNSDPKDLKFGYPEMEFFMNKTGRPMLFACEWPLNTIIVQKLKQPRGGNWEKTHFKLHRCNISTTKVQSALLNAKISRRTQKEIGRIQPDYPAVRKTCNMWRNYNDINDSWESINGIIAFWAQNLYNMSAYAGPGGWNDPDEIIIGNFGLSYNQERVQMGMWCMFAAPLLLSNDLRNIRNNSKALILNKRLLAINQDALGIQAKFTFKQGNLQVWTRPILPEGTTAVAVVNIGEGGPPVKTYLPLVMYGLQANDYDLTEAFDGYSLGRYNLSSIVTFNVNPTGIFMFIAKPVSV